MAFVPNGTIILCAGVPLDNSYTHTIKFASLAAQTAAFQAKAKHTYEHCTYIRETSRIRIPDVYDDVVMCNYLMYQNAGYGNDKWFYAFITGVYYVNDHATEIEFEIDVMQTWQFDYEVLPCFIERNHTSTDVIGEHLLPEPVETGEMIVNEQGTPTTLFKYWDVVAFTTFDWNTWTYTPQGNLTDGNVYSGLIREKIGQIEINYGTNGIDASASYTVDPTNKLADLINNHANLVDGLVALVLTPWLPSVSGVVNGIDKPSNSTVLAGYTPHNKKLYTWQFYRMFMNDGNGSGKWFSFEDFAQPGSTLATTFAIRGDCSPDQTLLCIPKGYKGVSANEYNFEEAMGMNGLPQCAWASDTFKTYMALNQGTIGLSLATSAASVIGGVALAATGAGAAVGAGMAASGVMGIISTLTSLHDKKQEPPSLHGSASTTAFFAVGRKAFVPCSYTIKPEYLRIADGFMDMYGYTIHTVGVPNEDVRPHWCYAKTQNAAIKPYGIDGLPASDMRRIETVYDTGVTFWKDMGEVGDYSLDNTI